MNGLTKKIAARGAIGFAALVLVATGFLIWAPSSQNQKMPAMVILPPAKKLGTQGELSSDKISALLAEVNLVPRSSNTTPVDEPDVPVGISLPPDADVLGFGSSKFLLDTRWATVRYIGDSPAGAGLSGNELNRAQIEALGRDNDSIPVTTTAQTINEMMEQYFAPLLRSLPRGEEILSKVKVQAAYFAPRSPSINGGEVERDNAFVVGVQSLYIHPNSCFDKTSAAVCNPPGYSAGHDPTIIGHELSHIIFNHVRDERSLEGWQWFAVNEGYADYFSASWFGDPVLGRVWRVTRPSGARYLRRLLDTPTTNDAKVLEEGHAFGQVWSSALWRSRNRIVSGFKAKTFDFDRVVLMSINFLGESTKTKLGDAAAAVLKATDVLGVSQWKSILIEEFKKSEVELARGQKIAAATGETIEVQQGGVKCGQIQNSKKSHGSTSALAGLLLLPLLLQVFAKLLRRFRRPLLVALLFSMQACQLSSLWKSEEAKPGGLAIVYQCNLANLRDGTPLIPTQRPMTLTFSDAAPTDARAEQIFVGDERFENAESSLLLIIDKSNMRIDQVRRRDGSLFQMQLGQKYLNAEDAIAVQNMRLATIIIEGAGRAWKEKSNQNPARNAVSFDVTGSAATATVRNDVTGARGFGPLANDVSISGNPLCTYEKTVK
ncbi:MAG: hypothetical protein ACO3A4_00580 [Silvanigrellaceae bacterium]